MCTLACSVLRHHTIKLWPCINVFSVKFKPVRGFTSVVVVRHASFPSFKCIFYRLRRRRREAGPLFVASSGAKDSLMLISLHLSPQAASCLPQLLMHFLFFLCFSPSFSLLVVTFSAPFFLSSYFLLGPPTWQNKIKGNGEVEEMAAMQPHCFCTSLLVHSDFLTQKRQNSDILL